VNEATAALAAAGISLLGSIIVALVAWGWRSEISTLRAEMRASIAESANTFYLQVNGNYTKKELHNALVSHVDGIEARLNDMGD